MQRYILERRVVILHSVTRATSDSLLCPLLLFCARPSACLCLSFRCFRGPVLGSLFPVWARSWLKFNYQYPACTTKLSARFGDILASTSQSTVAPYRHVAKSDLTWLGWHLRRGIYVRGSLRAEISNFLKISRASQVSKNTYSEK